MGINQQFEEISKKIISFMNIISNKLQHFPDLTLGEQISYACVGVGFILVLISLILFII